LKKTEEIVLSLTFLEMQSKEEKRRKEKYCTIPNTLGYYRPPI